MKTLKQLHDEQDNLPKIHAQVEQELKKIPGVIAVGIGFKQTKGQKTDTISFIVYVQEKKDTKDLLPEHIIPSEIQGVKTDVVKIASSSTATTTLPDDSKHRPVKGGMQIGNGIKDSAGLYHFGTLGCFALQGTTVVGLSNQHVMFAAGGHGPAGPGRASPGPGRASGATPTSSRRTSRSPGSSSWERSWGCGSRSTAARIGPSSGVSGSPPSPCAISRSRRGKGTLRSALTGAASGSLTTSRPCGG
jgi:copper chaperone CopZ